MNRLAELPPENLASPPKETIRGIFNAIASRYDLINTCLSLGLDDVWRKKATRLILKKNNTGRSILDLGVGTGKFLKGFLVKKEWESAVGIDFASEMLWRAKTNLPRACRLVQADIHDLPFEESSFDLVVSSFTLRSVKNLAHFFLELLRIVTPKGRIAFLCLTRPTSRFAKALYLPYLKFYLPFLGKILSNNTKAYRFLSESIQNFPAPKEVAGELESVGFKNVSIAPFTFGISTLITAQK